MIIVKPDTLIRWHRQGWRLLWRRKSRRAAFKPRVHPDTVALIRRMARDNRLWGAERIRGELLKLGIHLSKRTVQKYMRGARRPSPPGQSWRTFLRNHSAHIWACDFVQTFDIWFQPIFAFLIIGHGKRAAIHVGVTYHPTSEWVGQQLREATPFGRAPRFIIRDNDSKYGVDFDRVAATTAIRVLHTPIRGPDANAICERFIGSVRRECLDHVLVLGERHMLAVLRQYVRYFNEQRPHQGLGQRVPHGGDPAGRCDRPGSVRATPVLGGLHHSYACADG
jgi:transposase InsO family protein